MKSVEELLAIKAKMQDKIAVRKGSGETRIVVGMATCGIAAGARPVLNAFVEAISAAFSGVILTYVTFSLSFSNTSTTGSYWQMPIQPV